MWVTPVNADTKKLFGFVEIFKDEWSTKFWFQPLDGVFILGKQ